MNLNGYLNVLVHDNKDSSGKIWKSFVTDLSNKKEDGTYDNAPMRVAFGGKCKEWSKTLDARYYYKLDVANAFLTFKRYITKENTERLDFIIMVLDCSVKEKKMLPVYAEEEAKKSAREKMFEEAKNSNKIISEDENQITMEELPF